MKDSISRNSKVIIISSSNRMGIITITMINWTST